MAAFINGIHCVWRGGEDEGQLKVDYNLSVSVFLTEYLVYRYTNKLPHPLDTNSVFHTPTHTHTHMHTTHEHPARQHLLTAFGSTISDFSARLQRFVLPQYNDANTKCVQILRVQEGLDDVWGKTEWGVSRLVCIVYSFWPLLEHSRDGSSQTLLCGKMKRIVLLGSRPSFLHRLGAISVLMFASAEIKDQIHLYSTAIVSGVCPSACTTGETVLDSEWICPSCQYVQLARTPTARK